MGSPCEVVIYLDSNKFLTIKKSCLAEIHRIEKKYSRFLDNSITSKINRQAGTNQAITIDQETQLLLDYADQLFKQSEGLFDITSGILRKIWNFKSLKRPSKEQIDSILPLIGWDTVIRSEDAILLPKKGMQIDFGGFVKEYTADVLATLCLDAGISHGMINLGGDIKIIGPHPDGKPWVVGIQHPRKPEQAAAKVKMHTGAIATSGDYERYMMIDDTRYCHLLSPTTGESIRSSLASVTVIADSCLLAGSLSTLAMLKSPENPKWIDDMGVPFLKISQTMAINGTI